MNYYYDDDEEFEDDPLQKQFKILESEWDSIKQSISRSNRRISTTIAVAGDHTYFQPYDDSPEEFMTLLQNQTPAETIERPEADFEECFDADEESEVGTKVSCKTFEEYDENYDRLSGFRRSCMGSPSADVAEKGVSAVASGGRSGGSVGKWLVIVVVMLFAVVVVVFKCSSEHKDILVPT